MLTMEYFCINYKYLECKICVLIQHPKSMKAFGFEERLPLHVLNLIHSLSVVLFPLSYNQNSFLHMALRQN